MDIWSIHLWKEDHIDQIGTKCPENKVGWIISKIRVFTKDHIWWVWWVPWRWPSHPQRRWQPASPTWSQSHPPAVFCFVIFYQVQPISLDEGGLLHYWLITDWLAAVSLSSFNQVERDSFSWFFLALKAQVSSISGILVTTSRNQGITSRNRESQFDFGTQERYWTLVTF